jgi:threonine/homoserine/homoserine lactone efflux protein
MPPANTIGLFCVAALALLLIPGPAVLYIVTRSVDQGRRAGLTSVAGVHTGSVVHVAAAAAGLSAVLMTSATAYEIVKLAGAGYLIALGVAKLVRRSQTDRGDRGGSRSSPDATLRRVYAQGVVVNVLNPKTALFFLAFLPQFVNPGRGEIAGQTVLLGLVFILLGLCSDSCYALAAGTLAQRLRSSPSFVRRREVFSGCMYVGLGVVAAVAGHPHRQVRRGR